MDVFNWIENNFSLIHCDSTAFIYNDMASQSAKSLPVVYKPLNVNEKASWEAIGEIYDYLFSTQCFGGKILDVGPGDGWPSLVIAPFVNEVTGIDASQKRVEVCTENARRMRINNAKFIRYEPCSHFPFENGFFDAVVAASSIEQTPDPCTTLKEIYRVLKSRGRFRLSFESLETYKNGNEREAGLWKMKEDKLMLILYDRNIEAETVKQYALIININLHNFLREFPELDKFKTMTTQKFDELKPHVKQVRFCKLTHPKTKTYAKMLKNIGFSNVFTTYEGGRFCSKLFEELGSNPKPPDIPSLEGYLKPIMKTICGIETMCDCQMITAIK